MHKLLTSSDNGYDLSIGFDRSRDRRKKELLRIKILKANIMLEFI